MFPHERSLVKRMEGKPFALIGVNSDRDKDLIKKQNEKQQITWRSFWNGPQGTQGPISKAWKVTGWPTLYLIDHKGVIRRYSLGSPAAADMDKAIDELVKEAEKAATGGGGQ
jgi:hypothetical protein